MATSDFWKVFQSSTSCHKGAQLPQLISKVKISIENRRTRSKFENFSVPVYCRRIPHTRQYANPQLSELKRGRTVSLQEAGYSIHAIGNHRGRNVTSVQKLYASENAQKIMRNDNVHGLDAPVALLIAKIEDLGL
ncbi:hypothetical protein Trydic_g9635 [Trypoxylus dichotomus]